MILYYINEVERTEDVEINSLDIREEVQRRATGCTFQMNDNKPSENQEVILYFTVPIFSVSGTTLIIKDNTCSGESVWKQGVFREDQEIILGIGESDEEKVTISSINESTNTITLSAAISGSHAENDWVGFKIFAGTISGVSTTNEWLLANVKYGVECTDYTRIFDKKLINESYEDNSSLYIINDMLVNFINFNHLIDDMEYEDDAAIQLEWIETNDGDNPEIDIVNFKEGDTSGKFPWTNSGGTATFTASPAQSDVSELTGVSSGTPTEGKLAFWCKLSSASAASSISIDIGSDSSNYTRLTFTPESDTDWHYLKIDLIDGSETGTPDWTLFDYIQINITESASANILFDGIRIDEEGAFTFAGVEESSDFESFNMAYKKPTFIMQKMSEIKQFFWYIDFDKDVKFFQPLNNTAPFSISETSNNFFQLNTSVDTSQIINRQIVRGGETPSTETFSEAHAGDGVKREWVLKSKYKNLVVEVDSGAGYVVKTIGIEFLNDETLFDYMGNFNNRTVRASNATGTLAVGSKIKFTYNEYIRVIIESTESNSISSLKALVGGDGIFDGDVIIDESILTFEQARDFAQAQINKRANPIISASFATALHGLHAGQTIAIEDSNRGINGNFLIQSVGINVRNGDYFNFTISSASTVFGIIELFQKLLDKSVTDAVDAVIQKLLTIDETISFTDSFVASLDDGISTWGSDSDEGTWNLFQWS